MQEVEVAVAKIGKYATSESGDTFEMVERPRGGMSFVLADGQRSGKGAKFISNLVARKAISLLGEGVRDEAAAQAAHDYLFAYRGGQVSSTLNIVTIRPSSRAIVVARNNPAPVVVVGPEGVQLLDEPSQPVGYYEGTTPVITELPIAAQMTLVVVTDGISSAGVRRGTSLDLGQAVAEECRATNLSAGALADSLVARALALDDGRPADDCSVLALHVRDGDAGDGVRRMSLRMPLPP